MLDKFGFDSLSESQVQGFLRQALKGQSRAEAMQTLFEIRMFIDRLGFDLFGKNSWETFVKNKEHENEN